MCYARARNCGICSSPAQWREAQYLEAIAAATDAAKESEAVYSQNQTIRPSADGYFPADASARAGEVSSANEVAGEQDIDAIRREGLTGRQLRMARRVAQKHGLAPTSDFDAVRLLRSKGIDPFQRSNMLELVVPGGKPSKADAKERVQLPQTVRAEGTNLPAESLSPAERREIEITDIQNQCLDYCTAQFVL